MSANAVPTSPPLFNDETAVDLATSVTIDGAPAQSYNEALVERGYNPQLYNLVQSMAYKRTNPDDDPNFAPFLRANAQSERAQQLAGASNAFLDAVRATPERLAQAQSTASADIASGMSLVPSLNARGRRSGVNTLAAGMERDLGRASALNDARQQVRGAERVGVSQIGALASGQQSNLSDISLGIQAIRTAEQAQRNARQAQNISNIVSGVTQLGANYAGYQSAYGDNPDVGFQDYLRGSLPAPGAQNSSGSGPYVTGW